MAVVVSRTNQETHSIPPPLKKWSTRRIRLSQALVILGVCSTGAAAPQVPLDLATRTAAHDSVIAALKYLEASQHATGGWEAFGQPHLGVTALVAKCFVQDKQYGPKHPTTKRALAFVLKHVQPDGGIYVPDEGLRNYYTSVSLMALSATGDPAYAKTIKNAQDFLRKLQWDSGEGYERDSPWYGGQGYGRHKRPDLSNTQMMLEALHQSGLPPEDPAYQKAMVFITRCQMLGTVNDQPFAAGATDGGFIYTPANDGESKAGTEVTGDKPRLRSYGTMTYAGFKSMLYAKLARDDPRVKAAADWIQRHYTLDHNPNMPGEQSKQGLYYYYHLFSRAMKAWGKEVIHDSSQTPRYWRAELCEKLRTLQRKDGSWVNESDRWYEGNPHLVTAYAVLAIQTAITPPERH